MFLYFIKAVGLIHGYYYTFKNKLGQVGILLHLHTLLESGSRCWCSPGLQMFATPLPPIRNGFSVIFPCYRGADGLSTDISTRRLQISHTVRFGTEASLSWVFSTLGGISTAYFPGEIFSVGKKIGERPYLPDAAILRPG